MRTAAAIAILLLVASPAAAKPEKAPAAPVVAEESPYPCFIVRWYLQHYDRATLEKMGRARGIVLTPGQMKAALACEKG